jgi:hypothetical protein
MCKDTAVIQLNKSKTKGQYQCRTCLWLAHPTSENRVVENSDTENMQGGAMAPIQNLVPLLKNSKTCFSVMCGLKCAPNTLSANTCLA